MFRLLKMILFVGIIFLLAEQLQQVDAIDWKNLHLERPTLLILCVILLFLNWYLEWLKWKITTTALQVNTSTKTNLKAFLAGIATGLVTPNMLGNFIGRMYYYPRKERTNIILLTLLSNFSQFFASIFFGTLSLFFLLQTPFGIEIKQILPFVALLPIILLFFFFLFERFGVTFFLKKKTFSQLVALVKANRYFRIKLIFYSLLRHFVFTLQFWLLFNAFVDAWNIDTFFWIWQIYLWTTLIPSLWFGKLVIRESIALLVLGSLGFDQLAILITSILLWVINQALPALISLLLCRSNENKDE